MKPNGKPVSKSPVVTPMRQSGMMSQMSSVVRIELNRHTTINTISASTAGRGLANAVRARLESSYSPPHSSEYPGGNSICSIPSRTRLNN